MLVSRTVGEAEEMSDRAGLLDDLPCSQVEQHSRRAIARMSEEQDDVTRRRGEERLFDKVRTHAATNR